MQARDRSSEYIKHKDKCAKTGLCLRCSKQRDGQYQLCTECREKKKQSRNKLEQKRKVAGLCRCGKAGPVDGKTLCASCLGSSRLSESHQRDKNRAARVCITCGKETKDEQVTCVECQGRSARRTLERYADYKMAGVCPFCGDEKSATQFRCDKCHEKHLKNVNNQWHRYRLLVIDAYGGKCKCCDESFYEFIELDHIHGNGCVHRKAIGRHIYKWAINNDYPDMLQLLCANCNRGKSKYGVCPHICMPIVTKYRHKRAQIIEHYGSTCACCGEDNWAFLEFDHTNSDGKEHRLELGSTRIERWIIENDYPERIQLLCSNCNKAKGLYGICPHQQKLSSGYCGNHLRFRN